jgi:hypothetical protein
MQGERKSKGRPRWQHSLPEGCVLTATAQRCHTLRMVITDDYGKLLPKGAVIDLMPHSPHAGIVGYTETGQQVVAHNSKQHGRAVITLPESFNDGRIPVRLISRPATFSEADRIWQSAVNDVNRGVPWQPSDNCQDLVSRARTGRNGSPTRDALVGLALLAVILASL